jgi:hypothetical protein
LCPAKYYPNKLMVFNTTGNFLLEMERFLALSENFKIACLARY